MPGIAGILSREPDLSCSGIVKSMSEALLHEPYYVSGAVSVNSPSASFAWVRHAGSGAETLPFWNERRDVGLVFVGEHYADRTQESDCVENGGLPAPGDARQLVRLYERLGENFYEALNGWFSGLLIDLRQSKIVLFNDRYGLGRIYVHEAGDRIYFASEAKALLRVLPHLRQIDPRGLGEWLACGCVLQDRTLFQGMTLLPGASRWTLRGDGTLSKDQYFSGQKWESGEPLSLSEYAARVGGTLDRVIPRYFTGESPIGISLTGGVDSRMIMAAPRNGHSSAECYTFGGMYRESEDVKGARRVARVCDAPHQVLSLTGEFFESFPALACDAVCRTDGAMDVSGAVSLWVNSLAREIAPVRMTGNYGGEILRGLVHFRPRLRETGMLNSDLRPCLEEAAATYEFERRARRQSFIAFKQVPWHHFSRFALEQSKLTIRTPFLDNELVELSFQAPPEAYRDKTLAMQFIRERNTSLAGLPTDRGMAAGMTWLPVRARHFLSEFLPRAEYVYDYGMPHWMAKIDRVTGPLGIERLFLGRQKYSHFRIWYRRELSSFVAEVLLDPLTRSRPYLNKPGVARIVRDHIAGRGNYTTEIHQLLTLEMIERHLLKGL